jgi:hypothetical protein
LKDFEILHIPQKPINSHTPPPYPTINGKANI